MDPNTTLDIALDKSRPIHERQDALRDLHLWIERGGWLPTMWAGLDRTEALAQLSGWQVTLGHVSQFG